ncbi:ACT domain-containing protein [Colwellia sp. 20A7]|uniref:ACT domain-containing protein n=1 Tax=Colwellia sp. 20A7 TaxID=2689569 RepID=UPI00135C7924|nr:ACT domain-containing protein [Colwellia sp. 20A7]
MALTLKRLNESFAIHRLSKESDIPAQVFTAPIYFIAKTFNEVSIVLPDTIKIKSDAVEPNWRALEVVGPLDFSLTGILSRIATLLANESISIFAISTFDTDYILVKKEAIAAAITTLKLNDYSVIE